MTMYWQRRNETSLHYRDAVVEAFHPHVSESFSGTDKGAKIWRLLSVAVTLFLFCMAAPASAAPYTPGGDHVVLARLPQVPATLQAPSPPSDLSAALALARSQIDYASAQGDPRFLGYAEATLAPFSQDRAKRWWAAANGMLPGKPAGPHRAGLVPGQYWPASATLVPGWVTAPAVVSGDDGRGQIDDTAMR